jgi:hypothetical protein
MSSSQRLFVPVYSVTLLLSSFLLFLIQPLFGKMILPLLGGSPAIWNTAMVFFQAMLLAGYAYAHLLTRLPMKTQAVLHLILLLVCSVVLPIAVPEGWEPPVTNDPTWWQLMMMTVAVGGPFFVLAASAPMLQHWFSRTGHPDSENPYFLYAASNFGSMSALIAYPFLIEPLMTLHHQSLMWSLGYGALMFMIVMTAWISRHTAGAARHSQPEAAPANDNSITPMRIVQWLLLAFVPSSLMLGITSYMTTDLASVPLLWIVPLALYVSTFIIAFARVSPVRLNTVLLMQGFLFCLTIALFSSGLVVNKIFLILLHLTLFFTTALFCHMQLAILRPEARHLTVFYLIMSTGGVLGGIFNALIAPQIFIVPYEYAIVLGLAAFLRYQTDPRKSWIQLRHTLKTWIKTPSLNTFISSGLFPVMLIAIAVVLLYTRALPLQIGGAAAIFMYLLLLSRHRWIFALTAATILMLHPGFVWKFQDSETIAIERNFFGVLRVARSHEDQIMYFIHGTTLHGSQPLPEEYRLTPISYYYKTSGAGDLFSVLDSRPEPQHIAVLGLGIGSIICYSRPDRHFTFFEIDPDVVKIAENRDYFTYLSDCGSPYDVVLGDARLKMAKQPDNEYDMIFLDTFSSDNIPIHIITREAISLYIKKLKPNGLIFINISNRYLDLEPVVAAITDDLGLYALFKRPAPGYIPGTNIRYTGAYYALVAPDWKTLEPFEKFDKWFAIKDPKAKPWSDDYSNLVSAIQYAPRTVKMEEAPPADQKSSR